MKIVAFELFAVEPRWQFLKVTTDDGLTGWGEPIVPGRHEAVAAAVREMADGLIGRDPDQIEDIWQVLYRGGFFRGGPVLMAAMAGIDQALWDIKGKRYGLPVYQFLGGAVREKIQVYAWLGGDTPEAYAQSARDKVALGYKAVKMDGPSTNGQTRWVDTFDKIEAVVAKVAAVRQAIGSTIGVAVDFHGVAHKAYAKTLARELEPFHPLFIEEPILAEHNDALGEIAAHTTIPLATGERMYSRWDFKGLLAGECIDIVQPDLSLAGGISEVKKIATMAEAYDVGIAPHCPFGPLAFMASLQIDACTPNFVVQEQIVLDPQRAAVMQQYVRDLSVVTQRDGYVAVPSRPGLGIEINEEGVRAAAARGHHYRIPACRNEDGTVSEW